MNSYKAIAESLRNHLNKPNIIDACSVGGFRTIDICFNLLHDYRNSVLFFEQMIEREEIRVKKELIEKEKLRAEEEFEQ